MRAISARLVFVVGLAEGAFPAADPPAPLDVRRTPRVGDVSPRDRDRHAFLEALLGVRERLYLSYVAVEPKSGEPVAPSSVVLELGDALAPYLGASSSRAALALLARRVPLHRFGAGGGELPPAVARERWAVRARGAMLAHLRGRGYAVPDEDGMFALLQHDQLAALRDAIALPPPPPSRAPEPGTRTLALASLRTFLESPVQAWAQVVLGLDEVDDGTIAEHSDEPFHVDTPARAVLLREVLAAQLREPSREPELVYDAIARDLELRGQFPVGVFGAAERAVDLRVLARWREALRGEGAHASRLAFGRSRSTADLRPALDLELSPGRALRLVGQTELLLRGDSARATSVVPILGKAEPRTHYHLRGAIDHVVLAAAGLAPEGHAHVVLGGDGRSRRVEHAPWAQADARAYLTALASELLDAPHGYLLPFDQLARAVSGEAPARTASLGFGPVERPDGLELPPDLPAIAARRLGPLVERMGGDHGFGGKR
jgi:exodeoxyribonuclease V gamma subunit